jgi:hypothetical protein
VSYSSTICRSCDKNTYVNLESSGYLCADCLKKINEPPPQKQVEDLVLKKGVRWLQSWLYVENLDTTTIVVSWLEPQFTATTYPEIDSYYVFSECGRIQEVVSGELTQVICKNIDRDSDFKIFVSASVKSTPINSQLKKTFYNR